MRARAEEYLKLAQMEFAEPALMSDEEIAEVLSKADALKKWAEEVYAYAQNEAVVNHKEWPGYKLVWEEATVNIRMKRMWQRQHKKPDTRISSKRA